jgi:hypothetical protein
MVARWQKQQHTENDTEHEDTQNLASPTISANPKDRH